MPVRRVTVCALVALALGAAPAHACTGAHMRLRAANADKVARATVCLLNRRRAHAGLHKLRSNRKLRAAATAHSQDMVSRRYFEHDGPAGDTLFSRAEQVGYLSDELRAWSLAENIAYGAGSDGTASAIVRSWMGSSAHRANILTPKLRNAGVGLAQGTPDGASGATYTLDLGFVRN
jgi:uncharacterized protein YkwD